MTLDVFFSFIPGTAPQCKSMGLREIPCVDIRAACRNLLCNGLQLACALIVSGAAINVSGGHVSGGKNFMA